jgi:hypothetical protein
MRPNLLSLYIFEEFMPWFQQLLKSPEVKNKTKPIDLFNHQKLTKFDGVVVASKVILNLLVKLS